MLKAILVFVTNQQGGMLLDYALLAALLGIAALDVLVSRGASMSGELSQVSATAQ